jgi:hypothetical protein
MVPKKSARKQTPRSGSLASRLLSSAVPGATRGKGGMCPGDQEIILWVDSKTLLPLKRVFDLRENRGVVSGIIYHRELQRVHPRSEDRREGLRPAEVGPAGPPSLFSELQRLCWRARQLNIAGQACGQNGL